jgi:predicted transcriptional regulator
MPDEQPTELVAKIVGAYLRRHQVPPDQLAALISTVHQALGGLGTPAEETLVERTPAVSIRRSVQHDRVTCLECGFTGSVLRGHLTARHQLTPDAYRVRWNLPREHLLTAPAYSERRSTMAKQLGLGRGRTASAETMAVPEAMAEAATPPTPKRRGRPPKPRS